MGPDRKHETTGWNRRIGAVAVAAIAAAASIVALPAIASARGLPPTVTTTWTKPVFMPPQSGVATLHATVKNAKSCALSAKPPIPSLPSSVACSSSSGTYHLSVAIEGLSNGTPKPFVYTITLTAKSAGGATASVKVQLVVEAYAWSVSSRSAGSAAALDAIACSTPTTCVAVGKNGTEVTYTASTVKSKVVDGGYTISTVACAPGATTLCVLGDTRGAFIPDVAGNFGASIALNSSSPVAIASVACEAPSAGYARCLVVDLNGIAAVVELHQGSPTNVVGPYSAGTSGPAYATCEGPGLCEVADQSGYGSTTDTTSFTPLVHLVAGGLALSGFACGAALCIATDASGGATPLETDLTHCLPFGALPACARVAPNAMSLRHISCGDWLCVAISSSGAEQFSFSDPAGFRWGAWNGPVKSTTLTSAGALDAVGCVSTSFSSLPGCSFLAGPAGKQKEMTGHVTLLK